ncbi:MAG: hypothetical protein ACI9BC_000306, partial [Crocinitomicaceae bacterium]
MRGNFPWKSHHMLNIFCSSRLASIADTRVMAF